MGTIPDEIFGDWLQARAAKGYAAVRACLAGAQRRLGLAPQTLTIIGYARDLIVIFGVIASGFYLFANPERVDALLDWMIGRA
jgi:hypothetical protein